MTVQPTPYEILRAIQDQQAVILASQRATDRLVTMLAGMLDKSAPDPLMAPGPMLTAPTATPWQPRTKPQSNRPLRRMVIGDVPVMLSESRAKMIEAMAEAPRTTEDIVALGLSKSADAVRKAFVATNFEFTRLGIAHRIKPIERLSRVGPRGGSILPRYALVDPANETAPPGIPTAAQSEAAAGASPDSEAPCAAGDGDSIMSAQGASFAMPFGAGEGAVTPADPAPAADERKPALGIPGAPDRALDLWSTTDMLRGEIARQIGVSRTTVNNYLAEARARLDQRVIAGDSRRTPIPRSDDLPPSVVPAGPPTAECPPAAPSVDKPILKDGDLITLDWDPGVRVARLVVPKPAPLPPPPRTGATPIKPGDLLAVDVKQKRVQTKAGAYEVGGVNLARALDMMKGGHLFGLDVIAKRAGWPTADVAKTALGFEKNRLAQHGIDLFLDAKVGARLREFA